MKPKKKRASPWFKLAALCLVALTALLIPWCSTQSATNSVVPSPRGQEVVSQQAPPDLPDEFKDFPVVDWEYWQGINPAIIGWVTVPGTDIDYAVVQAPTDYPAYYLSHDIYGNWNPFGCPYVDADCDGARDRNTVIFGHNMGVPSMFADFSKFSDRDFAESHRVIYFQTPQARRKLHISSVAIVPGYEQSKRTEFSDAADLDTWYQERYSGAVVQLENDQSKHRLFTFVTCSYNYFSNERTLVYAQ